MGRAVDWRVVYHGDKGPLQYDITILESEIDKLRVTDEVAVAGAKPGTTVIISDLKRNFKALEADNCIQELSEIFALYLKAYKYVQISVSGERIDPSRAIETEWQIELTPIVDENDQTHPVTLEVIEWKAATKKVLYLCSEAGFPLVQVDGRFHVTGFNFSAYIKSSYNALLHQENRLELAELVPAILTAVEEARTQIKTIHRNKLAARAKVVVDEWKDQKIYPFDGEALNQIETAERQIFDIVAVTIQESSQQLKDASPQQLELHLRLLRQAIERSPSELQKILGEVLKLPKKKQTELADLLNETDLSGIISAAKMVADRLKFLEGLRYILFEAEAKKNLKERSQLHKILEQNTWVFGEEYNLWASDRELTTVLKIHKDRLDPDLVIDESVKVINKSRGIVDLMLSRAQRRHRANDIEHLVIELKAPKVPLTAEHLSQLEGYALAVETDPRFNRVDGLRWHFWLVGDEYDALVDARIRNGPDRLRKLVQKSERVTIGVRTWGEILEENNARLQFLKDKLEHNVDEGQALTYLRERHKEFLEGVIVENQDGGDNEQLVEASGDASGL